MSPENEKKLKLDFVDALTKSVKTLEVGLSLLRSAIENNSSEDEKIYTSMLEISYEQLLDFLKSFEQKILH